VFQAANGGLLVDSADLGVEVIERIAKGTG
jgi:hypothetical protein